ncbi:calcium-sensing receptor-like protein [Desulfurispirillum indicum S5]|uniref:Calcium-sensing receptor-like protein n=1 Tax=Desulfurispirillum indicum (strain ATCC BAA-1389 / DSM 22839 / S5) TaxID=653733 RepID=E6W2W4_DESIS|nr:calcium-sensing receptor-like protein [Desulfurispirillum indicum S5]
MVLHKLRRDIILALFMSFFCHFGLAQSGWEAAPMLSFFSRPPDWNWEPQTTALSGFWFAVAALVATTLRVHRVMQARPERDTHRK